MKNWPTLLLLAASFLMLNADKRVLSCFSPFVFSLSHTSTLSHHTHTSKPLSFSLYSQTHNLNSYRPNLVFRPKLTETARNRPKSDPRWNRGTTIPVCMPVRNGINNNAFWAGLEKWTHWVAIELRCRLLFLCVCVLDWVRYYLFWAFVWYYLDLQLRP